MAKLSHYLANEILSVLDELEHLHVKSDIEHLHQFRVYLRRCASLLKLYRPHSSLRNAYHEVHINFKISRYAMVFLHEKRITQATEQIAKAKSYQSSLGVIQDLLQQIKLLKFLHQKSDLQDIQSVIFSLVEKLNTLKGVSI